MSDCYLYTKWQAVKPNPFLLHGAIFKAISRKIDAKIGESFRRELISN